MGISAGLDRVAVPAGRHAPRPEFSLVRLDRLMSQTAGSADILIGLIDGPVHRDHPDLRDAEVKQIATRSGDCLIGGSACEHGTFVCGMLAARRDAPVPGICPGCTFLSYPMFGDAAVAPTPTAAEVAAAIAACVSAGARLINLSAALNQPTVTDDPGLRAALDDAARRGVLVVAAAGNQATLAGWTASRHPWVITVASCTMQGRPAERSNLGASIGRWGLAAPGERIVGLDPAGGYAVASGTSYATAFVTGAAALLWSVLPQAGAADVRHALTWRSRRSVAPPLLDADAALNLLSALPGARRNSR